jgi:hypothetical protein
LYLKKIQLIWRDDIPQQRVNDHIDISTIKDISSKNILHDEPHHPKWFVQDGAITLQFNLDLVLII